MKQTEIGLVPEDWRVVPFTRVLSGNIKHGIYKSKEYLDSRGTRILKMGIQYSNEKIGSQEMERVRLSSDELNRFKIEEGDLIFSRTSMMEEGAGNVSIVIEHSDPIVFDGNLLCVTIKREIAKPAFYFYYFRTNVAKQEILKITTGTQSRNIAASNLARVFVPLPNYEEQVAIANTLSILDSRIELDKRMNETLEAIGQAVFKRWFVDFELPNEEGKPYKSSGGEMVYDSYLRKEIPKRWKVGKIEDVADVVGGGTPSTKVESYFADKGIPWLTPKDLSGYAGKFIDRGATDITEEGLKNSSAKLMPKGTILFTSRAPIGYVAIALNEIATNQGFKSFVPKKNMKSEYLYQYIKRITPYIQSISSGSTFGEITGSALKEVEIIIPQYTIVERFEELTSPINSKIINNVFSVRTLKEIRDSLLPKLMSGKIRVPAPKENIEAQ